MVMMFYIISFLSTSRVLQSMPGGDTMQSMLELGCGVIGVFSLIFLFYTNSFFAPQTEKRIRSVQHFGDGKAKSGPRPAVGNADCRGTLPVSRSVRRICSSKFAELGMLNILSADVTFSLTVEPGAIGQTLLLFCRHLCADPAQYPPADSSFHPIALLHSENTGEKPPKAN